MLLIAWLIFPLLLAALSLGWGLLVDRLAGGRVSGLLLLPLGLAALFVVTRIAMEWDATAELATPLVVVGAVVGLWLGRDRLRIRALDHWILAATLAVFAIYAAPVVLSGDVSFAGYTVLGDTAAHFVLIDWISSHGTQVSGLEPSSYRVTLQNYIGSGYPLGAHTAIGAVRPLVGSDIAWVYQPYLAFIGAMLMLTVAGLLEGVVRRGWRIAAIAAIAAQPALVYAYALQGSIKELSTLWLVTLLAALVAALARLPAIEPRRLVPLLVASAAAIAAIGLAVAPWLGPMLLAALWAVFRAGTRRVADLALLAAGFGAGLLVLSLPTLLSLGDYVTVTRAVVTAQEEYGNLLAPLDVLQAFGTWLAPDYRLPPTRGPGLDHLELTYGLIGLTAVLALLGVVWLIRRRIGGPLLLLGSSLLGLWYITRTGSPWADAKAIVIASPAILLAALLGPVALESIGARAEAALLGLALVGGVLVSNAYAYHTVSLAPTDRFEELAEIGDLVRGEGPLLFTEFEEYTKHFLRDADPVAMSGARVPRLSPKLRDGRGPKFGQSVDLRRIDPAGLARFRTLLTRRTPFGVVPPAGWRREHLGRYYEVWRNEAVGVPGEARAACPLPPGWVLVPEPTPEPWKRHRESRFVETVGPGTVSDRVDVARAGVYEVWLEGSFGREVVVAVDGVRVGSVQDELAFPAGWIRIARVPLTQGRHRIDVSRTGGSLAPGNGDGPRRLGGLALTPAAPTAAVCGS